MPSDGVDNNAGGDGAVLSDNFKFQFSLEKRIWNQAMACFPLDHFLIGTRNQKPKGK